MTTAMYTIPVTPTTPKASAAFATARHGTLTIAEMSNTAQKCTTVGVPKAPTSGPSERASAPSTTTTNCRPVSAAADEAMSTWKCSPALNGVDSTMDLSSEGKRYCGGNMQNARPGVEGVLAPSIRFRHDPVPQPRAPPRLCQRCSRADPGLRVHVPGLAGQGGADRRARGRMLLGSGRRVQAREGRVWRGFGLLGRRC